MIKFQELNKIGDYEWEIPKSYRPDMRVPVHIFASRRILKDVIKDRSLEQAINSTTLPGIVGYVAVMPDVHLGYGFPIGGVAATRYPDGVISPGGIGYDINCGVRLMSTQIVAESVTGKIGDLVTALNHYCPSGVGVKGNIRLSVKELEQLCRQGSQWLRKQGYATREDVKRTENSGCISGADPGKVSPRAMKRGRPQVGSLGAGNHFIEIDIVSKVDDQKAAGVLGLKEGYLALQIHSGSRGFGHQICTDYVRELQGAVQRFGIELPDRELVCAPLDSREGEAYLAAMRCAANYAFANRQVIAHYARIAFEKVLSGKVPQWDLRQVYDIAHNMGNIETHTINRKKVKVCVHRKGATRAFGPGHKDLPVEYQQIGQPVLVPGSMGTASWVLLGTQESMERSYGSTCHGAGRTMSRTKAKKTVWGEDLRKQLEKDGIHIRAGSMAGLAEEAPLAYKDVDEVVRTVVGAGIARKVARLRPIAVVKG